MKGKRTLAKDVLFVALCLVILAVAATDVYLNLRFPISSPFEKNPLAAALLEATGQDHYLLMSLKVFTTGLAVLTASFCYFHQTYMGVAIAASLALFMGLCLVYMLI